MNWNEKGVWGERSFPPHIRSFYQMFPHSPYAHHSYITLYLIIKLYNEELFNAQIEEPLMTRLTQRKFSVAQRR
jgi:hypothetical protein